MSTVFPNEGDNLGEGWKDKKSNKKDSMSAEALFKKHDSKEFLFFDRIKIPLHKLTDLCGLLYLPDIDKKTTTKMLAHADYEICSFTTKPDVINKLTEEQVIYLLRCGIAYDSQKQYLYIHT